MIWKLEHPVRPDFTLNKERTVHHMKRAKIVKEWRAAFCDLAQAEMVPRLEQIEVIAQPWVLSARYRQDVGACFPLVKAAIDGLVDAGVLIDDNAKVVTKLTFLSPEFGRDGLELTVVDTLGRMESEGMTQTEAEGGVCLVCRMRAYFVSGEWWCLNQHHDPRDRE